MRRRKSEAYKRRRKKLKKFFVKLGVKLAIPTTLLIMFGSQIKDAILNFDPHNLLPKENDYAVEEIALETDVPEAEVEEVAIDTEPVILEVEENKEEDQEESIEEEIEEELDEEVIEEETEPEDIINTDLVDMAYEFKDIDFEELTSQNSDCIGWIAIDGTHVDYPLLQGEDNEEYLHKDIDGNYSKKGSIYLDANNESFINPYYSLDDLSFIYGHHMAGGKMFADICKYKKQSFYDEHPFFVIYTSDGLAYKADVFAGILEEGKDNSIFNGNFAFDDYEDFENYMAYLNENSLISSDLSVEYGDKIVALITCSYENGMDGNLRFVVFARLSKQYTNELQYEHDAVYALR